MGGQELSKKPFVLKGIAGTLNFCGGTLLFMYDTLAHGACTIGSAVKKTKSLFIEPAGFQSAAAREEASLLKRIGKHEKRLTDLYYELGRERAEDSKSEEGGRSVEGLLNEIKEQRRTIEALKENVAALQDQEKVIAEMQAEVVSAEMVDAVPLEEEVSAEKETPVETVEEVKPEEQSPPEPKFTESRLNKMLKRELIDLCRDLKIECEEKFTKVQIIGRILECQEK